MVGQISVFPDVGAAFFGSYRGARNQRLQESAMRAEMAAAQAERQRQSQAREAFARLQGPDQRVEQVAGSTNFGPSPVEFTQNRVTRQGMTPEQRAHEEQRLAQADPEGYMSYRQSRQGPEIDLSDIYDVQASRVLANPESMESAVTNAVNVAASRGQQITPQQAYAEIQGRIGVPEEPDRTSAIQEYEYAVEQGYQGTFQQYQTQRAAAGRPTTNFNMPASAEDIQVVPQEIVERMGLPPGVYTWRRDSQGNVIPSPIRTSGGSGGGAGTPSVGGEVLDDLASQVDRGVIEMDDAVGNYVAMSRESGNTEVSPEFARMAISHRLSNESIGFEQANAMARHSFESDRAVVRQLRAVDDLYNVSAEYGSLASGLGANLAFIRGTPAAQVKSYLENVTSQEIVDQLREMREYAQSIGERGSGFGQLTQNEIRIMEAMQTLLSQDMPPERLRREAETFARELHFARSERLRAMEMFMPEVYSEFSAIQNRSESFRSPGVSGEGGDEDITGWDRF